MSGERADRVDERFRAAFLAACHAELRALKPGNVHDFADGHRMTVADFEASAAAAAPEIARRGASVGERVLSAMRATHAAVGQNTNLGILLLVAPMAVAWERLGEAPTARAEFRDALDAAIRATTVADAEAVYAAIRIARPGGLGSSAEQDVAGAPTVALSAAMAAAAGRDRIARQYVTVFADLFEVGLPALDRAMLTQPEEGWRTSEVYFAFAETLPDTHVQRKHGPQTAEAVRSQFAEHRGFLDARNAKALLMFDKSLKSRDINPGTSADFTVATLFLAQLTKNK